jgi:hypothetical protein
LTKGNNKHWKEKAFKINVLNVVIASINESIESGGCVLYQARNIIVVIGTDPNL